MSPEGQGPSLGSLGIQDKEGSFDGIAHVNRLQKTEARSGEPAMRMATPPEHAGNKRLAPSTMRNREPIRRVLREVLPTSGNVLEIASGTGEHAVYLSTAFPRLTWYPSDVDPESLDSVAAWSAEAKIPNLRPVAHLDVTRRPWSLPTNPALDAVVCINLIHIAPWEVCEGLMAGAGDVLGKGGTLFLYGPYTVDGEHIAPSNAAFDAHLKAMDATFGVRDVADVSAAAANHGLTLEARIAMPANNLSLVFRKHEAYQQT